jgi:hypothetical protein
MCRLTVSPALELLDWHKPPASASNDPQLRHHVTLKMVAADAQALASLIDRQGYSGRTGFRRARVRHQCSSRNGDSWRAMVRRGGRFSGIAIRGSSSQRIYDHGLSAEAAEGKVDSGWSTRHRLRRFRSVRADGKHFASAQTGLRSARRSRCRLDMSRRPAAWNAPRAPPARHRQREGVTTRQCGAADYPPSAVRAETAGRSGLPSVDVHRRSPTNQAVGLAAAPRSLRSFDCEALATCGLHARATK